MADISICRCENFLPFDIFDIWTSTANVYPLASVIWHKKKSNGKNNSQLKLDNFVISRLAITEKNTFSLHNGSDEE